MVDPGTAIIIASALATAAGVGGSAIAKKKQKKSEKKSSKFKAREAKRETLTGGVQEALGRSAELEQHGLGQRGKLGRRKAQSMQDTSDLVREALNI